MASSVKILVVDDSLLARMMLKKFVGNLHPDWLIIEAKNGNEALEQVEGKHLDVALIDYNMPGMTGLDLARKLKEQCPEIAMALITANIQDYIANEAKSIGMEFISKPIEEGKISIFFSAMGK